MYGQSLYNILAQEGYIGFSENRLALKTIIERDINRAAMRIMGKIGEAVIVRRCTQYKELNRKWMILGSFKQIQSRTAEKYTPVGTGLHGTKESKSPVYSPSDTQRDIVWVDDDDYRFTMRGSDYGRSKEAGLQVKVSSNGKNYILDDVLNSVYEVPLAYFDLDLDYWLVFKAAQEKMNQRGIDKRILLQWFISAREVDSDAYDEVKFYSEMVLAILNGKLSVDDLIRKSEKTPTFANAIANACISDIANQSFLEASSDWDSKLPHNGFWSGGDRPEDIGNPFS